MLLLFIIYAHLKLTFSHGKRGFLAKFQFFINISFSFGQNFMKLHGYIVYLKFHHVPLFLNLCVFQFDTLLWKKGVSCKYHEKKRLNAKFQFLLISPSVLVKIS